MKINLLTLVALSVIPLSSFAADGDITFTGTVKASACSLQGFNGGEGKSALMQLSSVTPSSFSSAGGYAGMKDFTIDLKECDTTTMKNARVSFSGTPDLVDNSILKNIQENNAAQGVGIAILENDGSTVIDINGGVPSKSQALTQGNTELEFKVAYKANTSTPAVSSGDVKAKTFIDIAYN